MTLTPSTIAGGSGSSATGTITLSAPAPAGGVVIALSSSNVELAATMPTVTVAAGAITASFSVATNPGYRAYSNLSFSAIISATLGTARTAVLSVTAQPRPADFTSGSTAGSNTQWDGLMCGGIAPIGGRTDILYTCSPAGATGFGTCTFQQECAAGCRRVPPNGSTFNDFCATSGPNPIEISDNYFTSGDHVQATVRTAAPVVRPTTGVPRVLSIEGNARSFSPDDVGGLHFPVGSGATTMNFDVATSYVPQIEFIDVGGFWYDADLPPLLITNGRGGHLWAVMLPPIPPPADPIPTPVQFKIVGLNPTTGNQGSLGQVHTSGVPHGIGPTISFTSSHPSIVPAPASVTPPAGNLFGFDVTIDTVAPPVDTNVTITASDGRYSFSAVLTVRAAPPPAVLSRVTVSPGSVAGGATAVGTVHLSAPQSSATVVKVSIIDVAPASLPSNNPPCPPSSLCHNVTVPAGATSANFGISTRQVTSQFNLNIFAELAGSPGQSALLLITPGGGPTALNALTITQTDFVGGGAPAVGVVTLTGQAPAGGAVIALTKAFSDGSTGTVPVTIPVSLTVPAGQTTASFTIATSAVTAVKTVLITAAFNGSSSASLMSLFPLLAQVQFSGSVPGGTPGTGSVILNGPAPGGGVAVALTSGNTALATVPAGVTVLAGQSSVNFIATTQPVSQATAVPVSASARGTTVTANLFLVISSAVTSVTLTPGTIAGPASVTGRVTLSSASPGNSLVTLVSSNPAFATVPVSVIVPQGQASATFPVNVAQVATTTSVQISATFENVTRTATLTITPPAAVPGSAATLSVTAAGRSGERVTSTPAGISVIVGTTGSASFTTGTSITLRVTNNRDAIWSGACSSGGNKTKTCTFTMNASASVTANVQ